MSLLTDIIKNQQETIESLRQQLNAAQNDVKLVNEYIDNLVAEHKETKTKLRQQLADVRNESAAFAQLADQRYDETKEFQKQLAEANDYYEKLLLATALEDTRRLEFFEAYGDECICVLGKSSYFRAGYQKPHTKAKSLRDAIDCAMKLVEQWK